MSLIEKLESKENLTAAESALADYILENLDSVYRMSLQDLAKASYVSKPSVIRLYRKVGCSNYREFSIALQLERISTYEANNSIEYEDLISDSGSTNETVGKLGIISKQIIDNCVNSVDSLKLDKITDALFDADQIYIFSCGNDLENPESFADYVGEFMKRPIVINSQADPEKMIDSFTKKDAALIILGNENNDSDELQEKVFASNATRILITTANEPENKYPVDYVLYSYPTGSDMIRSHAYVSQLSITMGLNIIYTCLYLRAQKKQKEA